MIRLLAWLYHQWYPAERPENNDTCHDAEPGLSCGLCSDIRVDIRLRTPGTICQHDGLAATDRHITGIVDHLTPLCIMGCSTSSRDDDCRCSRCRCAGRSHGHRVVFPGVDEVVDGSPIDGIYIVVVVVVRVMDAGRIIWVRLCACHTGSDGGVAGCVRVGEGVGILCDQKET